jgi:hypothetical protein
MPMLSKAERNYHRQLFEDFDKRCHKLGLTVTQRASLFGTTVATYSSWMQSGAYSHRTGTVRKLRTPANLKQLNAALMRLARMEKTRGLEPGPRHYLGDPISRDPLPELPPKRGPGRPPKLANGANGHATPASVAKTVMGWTPLGEPPIPVSPETDTHPYKVLLVNGKGVHHYHCNADPSAMLVDWVQRYGGRMTVVPKVEGMEATSA